MLVLVFLHRLKRLNQSVAKTQRMEGRIDVYTQVT